MSPAMVIPESSHIGYQIFVLKVFCGNFRYIFLYQVFEERKKQRFFFFYAKVWVYTISIMCVMWNLGSVRLTIQPWEYVNGCISNTLCGFACRHSCSSALYIKIMILPLLKRNSLGFKIFWEGNTITKLILICFKSTTLSLFLST